MYFSSDCFDGFNDEETGFYTVYRNFFNQILEQEMPHKDKKVDFEYPSFGTSNTDLNEVKRLYDIWQSFSTSISFAHLDRHDIRQAPNRRIVRLMEKENNKIREEARKNRNVEIQVAFT